MNELANTQLDAGSFRDPAGFVFSHQGEIFRQVNSGARQDYELLMSSGLYEALTQDGSLVSHAEAEASLAPAPGAYRVLRPTRVPYISYPYEWSFSQLKDAALLTLRIQKKALEFGMSLKDATPFNIQFPNGRPVFIDTLSFEKYEEGRPWPAYHQFCKSFLAPLTLMERADISSNRMLRVFTDGIPMSATSSFLQWRGLLNPSLLMHVHLHKKAEGKLSKNAAKPRNPMRVSKNGLLGLLSSLESAVAGRAWAPEGTVWADYYENAGSYEAEEFKQKKALVSEYLDSANPRSVLDLGANSGVFSELAAEKGASVIACDADPACVEQLYLRCRSRKQERILPLLIDLTNPSPGLGWAGAERKSFNDRFRADAILFLAVIHHLAIAHNVPMPMIAQYLASLAGHLVIEFVPKEDKQVQKLLAHREDIFPSYHREGFEEAFLPHFEITRKSQVGSSHRWLYLLRRR